MKLKLLIAASDADYVRHLSSVLSKRYADSFDVSVCLSQDGLKEQLDRHSFDVAVLDSHFTAAARSDAIRLPFLLLSRAETLNTHVREIKSLLKYQRISDMASQILEMYGESFGSKLNFGRNSAKITVVWSPVGGCGKTTVALAYATQSSANKKVVYLDMEPFSSTSVYFSDGGKSLSHVFEKLQDPQNDDQPNDDRPSGRLAMSFKSIRQEDKDSGILYFDGPVNYDDIAILTENDLASVVRGASIDANEVVVDMGSTFDKKVQRVMEMADQVLLVTDGTETSRVKCNQFRTQHNMYLQLKEKLIVVANRGDKRAAAADEKCIVLPKENSSNPKVLYKMLASYFKSLQE